MREFTIGTRRSPMALVQTQAVVDAFARVAPDVRVRVEERVTSGDRDQTSKLSTHGGKGGAFVSGLRHEILTRSVDMAMHSLKDVPGNLDIPGLMLGAFLPRDDPRDVLITSRNKPLEDLPDNFTIGTNAVRRKSYLHTLFPRAEIAHCRGAVNNRISKLDDGKRQDLHEFYKDYDLTVGPFDALVVAYSGIIRLGKADRIRKIFEPWEMLPAVGQGICVVECRADNSELLEVLSLVNDRESYLCALAERTMLRQLNGHCNSPIAGFCKKDGHSYTLTGAVLSSDGSEKIEVTDNTYSTDTRLLGRLVAAKLLLNGAREIIDNGRTNDPLEEVYFQSGARNRRL
jgi:hydroxymethylbilane synthase